MCHNNDTKDALDFLKVEYAKAAERYNNNDDVTHTIKNSYAWQEDSVDQSKPHFMLCVGEGGSSPKTRVVTALVGPPKRGMFSVEWIDANPERQNQARQELDFYLVEKREPNPWLYLHYHTGTAANLYSSVHWAMVRPLGTSAGE